MDEIVPTKPLLEVILGTLGLIVIIFVHGVSIRFIDRRFNEAWVHMTSATPRWRLNLVLVLVIGAMATVHLFETFLWAAPIYLAGVIPKGRDAYYYVLESYTTLGEGAVSLPDKWRLVGPIIAMSGLFTFGWTGSVLVSIMTEFGKFDRSRAQEKRDAPPGRDTGA